MADIVISVDSSQVRSARGDVNDLGLTVVKQAQVIQRLERHYKLLDKSFNTGKISAQQYAAGVQQIDNAIATVQSGQFALAAATNKTTSAIEAQSAALQRSHKDVNNFGMVSQQIGYQVGDFFVQVQSGTNALTAFGQQATQLAGLLPGLAGAIVGIGVSLGTAFLNMSLRSRGLTISFQKMGEDLSRAFEPLRPMLDFIPKALGQATNAVNSFGQMVAQNFERVVAYTVAFATLLATKVVAGFVLSGAAARTFFTILRAGLISTGVGALVVAFGELLLAMNKLIKGAGSFSQAWKLVVDVFKEAFDRMIVLTQGFINVLGGYWEQLTAGFLSAVNKMRANWATLLDLLSLGVDALGMTDEAARLEQAALDARAAVAQVNTQVNNLQGNGANRVRIGLQQVSVAANSAWSSIDALKKALQAGDMGSVSIDPSSWLVPDDSDKKGKSGKESQLAQLIQEQKERAVLLTLYGKEKILQQEIFAIRKQLGDEANKLTPQQIKDLAEINLLLSEQEEFQQNLLQNYQQIADTLKSSMEDAFMSIVSGTESAKDAFKKMAFSIIQELYRVLVVQRLVGSFNATTGVGTGLVGAIGSAFSGGSAPFFGGGRATGGSIMPNRPYLVGEHGPELVIPRHSGTVVNANQTANAMGGSGGDITVQNNITVTGSDAAMVRAEVAKMIPQITNATKAAVIDAKQRGGQMAAAFR